MAESIITKEFVQTIIRKRDREIHKGDCGRILIVAGSKGMAGAAILAAKGALRSGSGLVQIAVPEDLFPIIQVGVPEATCLNRDFKKIDLGRYDGIAVGPGLGENAESVETVKFLLENFDGPMVLDADGLNIVAHNDFFPLLKKKKNVVITPHQGEAERLLGKVYETRRKTALELFNKTGAITVFKGQGTVVAIKKDKTYINTTGNPGMATAGSGDVLTGIIAGFLGQRHMRQNDEIQDFAANAALCGVFVHGLAGDLAAKDLGEYGLIAGDIAYYTAIALKNISG